MWLRVWELGPSIKKCASYSRKTQSDCWWDTVMASAQLCPQLWETLRPGHSPCRLYCTVPGTSKHSPVQCLLFVSPACLPLTWLQLPVSLCSERETVWGFFWVLTVKQELSLLFTISLSCWTLERVKEADAPLYCNVGLTARQWRSLCSFTPWLICCLPHRHAHRCTFALLWFSIIKEAGR